MSEHVNGGAFLLRDAGPDDVFTPEDFTPDQRMFAKTARDFVRNEVLPASDRIEAKDLALSRELIQRAGALGLLMADVPEEFGGLGLEKASSALIAESLTGQSSWMMMANGHTGIGTLPIVYYGSQEIKERYLPALAEGSKIGCYALTEPTAGSDALACRTKAVLSEDGTHFVLNGTKQFITNAGIADVFTVFAKVDGTRFTGFVLDRDTPGLTLGPEEHKMGRRGSSTTTVILQDARVPAGNVLGEIGQGHKIAFNILNMGRFKVGAQSTGSAKHALEAALAYCLERKQFGKRIAEFGAIREKLGEMFTRIYASESAVYRTVGLIDRLLAARGSRQGDTALRAIEEYNVECAVVKVLGTETLGYVADEALQCFGGYGYCEEYPVERHYRDARIARIYEGTNEINRILVPTLLLRRAARGELGLLEAAAALEVPGPGETPEGLLAAEARVVSRLKMICLYSFGAAVRAHGEALGGRQMLLIRLADLVSLAYTAEATLLRAAKDVARRGGNSAALAAAAAGITCEDSLDRAESLARQILSAAGDAGGLETLAALVRRRPADTVGLREVIAARLVEAERTPFF